MVVSRLHTVSRTYTEPRMGRSSHASGTVSVISFAIEPNLSSATNDRLWRTRRPSASPAHCRSGDQF
jgi:hypothetical protein